MSAHLRPGRPDGARRKYDGTVRAWLRSRVPGAALTPRETDIVLSPRRARHIWYWKEIVHGFTVAMVSRTAAQARHLNLALPGMSTFLYIRE